MGRGAISKGASKKCAVCDNLILGKPSLVARRTYCSKACWYSLGLTYKPASKSKTKKCLQCGKEFQIFPSQKKRYCTYKCHLDSGGAFRAGMEAAKMKKKYGAKKDANHNELVEILLKMGVPFYDLSAVGCGVPDGIAWVKNTWQFVEIKNPKTRYGMRGLNPIQRKWITQWRGGGVYILKTVDDAINFARGDFSSLEIIKGE